MDPSPLKIGIVCYPTVGGSGVVATEIAKHAARCGHQVHLLSYDRPSRLHGDDHGVRYHNVRVSAYPLLRYPPYALSLATQMLEVVEEHELDVFHVHYAIPHAVSAFLARSMSGNRLKCITTLHGTDITVVGADPSYARPTRFAIEESNAVTAVSKFLADETRVTFAVEKPIEVIPNFVDTQKFKAGSVGRYYDRSDEERVIVHISNFRPVKRVADVVRAFAHIRRSVPSRLILVGDGPDREHAMAIAGDTGCIGDVEHIGNVESTESVLANADLFLLASETESFGLSMLEAMSCGVPCVSTHVGGVHEVLGDTGALTALGNPGHMAKASVRLLTDADAHRAASIASRRRAEEQFDQATGVQRYIDLYRNVIQSP